MTIAKVLVSITLFSYLIFQAYHDKDFHELVQKEKDWGLVALAAAITFLAVTLTLLRWKVLVLVLDLPLTWWESLQIGFLAYMTNLLGGVGVAGGDAIKAVLLARRAPGRRTAAVASVLMDRVSGFYVLVVMTAIGLWFLQRSAQVQDANLVRIGRTAQLFSLVGSVALGLLLIPGFADATLWNLFGKIPFIGKILLQLVEAVRVYRQRIGGLFLALGMSLIIHCLYVLMFYVLAGSLHLNRPTLGQHFVMIPTTMAAGSGPLGMQETVLTVLYQTVLTEKGQQGFLLAIAYRVLQVIVAGVGLFAFQGKDLSAEADETAKPNSEPTT